MKPSKLKVVLLFCMVALLAASAAWAGARNQISAQVPHGFMIGETEMPAGKYLFELESSSPPMITCRSTKGGGSSIMHVITTLARTGMDEQEAKLVFDKSAGNVELSEVWFAGQDGFLVCGTVDSHTHDVLEASN